MNVTIGCPFCGQKYELDEFNPGAEVQCAKCGQNFTLEMSLVDTSEPAEEPVNKPFPPIQEAKKAPVAETQKTNKPEPPKSVEPPAEQSSQENRLKTVASSGDAWLKAIFIVLVVLALFQTAVMTEKTVYTYMVHEVKGREFNSIEPEKRTFFSTDFEERLFPGSELVAAIPLVETIQKNYGNDKYVTGLRSHTRTESVMLVVRYSRKVRFYQSDFWK